jgi:hypothetical protein
MKKAKVSFSPTQDRNTAGSYSSFRGEVADGILHQLTLSKSFMIQQFQKNSIHRNDLSV